jgi:hypothetical protein
LAVCAPLQPNDTGADAALQPGTQDATPPDAPSADTGDDGAAEVGIDASLDGGDARD